MMPKWCGSSIVCSLLVAVCRHPIVSAIATVDRFQGLQAQVILASLVSPVPGIMSHVWRANTLTSRAQSELHLFGRFAAWAGHPTPRAWIAALNEVQWEAGSAAVGSTLEWAGVFREVGVIDRVRQGTIYRLGGGAWGTGCVSLGRRARGHVTPGAAPGHAD